MIDSSFAWASKHGLVRTNDMHGEEEARLILDDSFSTCEHEGERSEQTMTLTTEES